MIDFVSEFISSYDFSIWEWLLIGFCGTLIGAAKTGMSGASLLAIPIFATIFGGKASTGYMLLLLMFADCFAITTYRKNIHWNYVVKLLPWTILGIIIALLIGQYISDEIFKRVLGVVVIASVAVMLFVEKYHSSSIALNGKYIVMLIGVTGGIASMIGNAANPIFAIFFLSLGLSKLEYVTVNAWFFFFMNMLKLPVHIFMWKTITVNTLLFDLTMLPAIAIGALIGYVFVKIIPEKYYRTFIILAIVASAVKLFV